MALMRLDGREAPEIGGVADCPPRRREATPSCGLCDAWPSWSDTPVRRVRIVFPTEWDRKQLVARPELWQSDFELSLGAPSDADCRYDFDVLGYVDDAIASWRGDIDGVLSSSDYPGATVAGAIATGLGLPGSTPGALLAAAHKILSRRVQAAIVPEATPAFWALDPDAEDPVPADLTFPCFVKPAKGAFSMFARRVDSPERLRLLLTSRDVATYRRDFLRIYADLVSRYADPGVDARAFIAESLLTGELVTLEGYCTANDVVVLGIVDSLRDPATQSFSGFVYPSALDEAVQRRMADACRRLVRGLDLRWTFFNVELMWDPVAQRLGIIEVNARLCGQFADLYEKVHGVHSYRLALELACGAVPRWQRGRGPYDVAASFPLRVYRPVRVTRAPDPEALAAAEALGAGTRVWTEVATGDVLEDFASEDGASCRYAVVNLGAADRTALDARLDAVRARLGYAFDPLL